MFVQRNFGGAKSWAFLTKKSEASDHQKLAHRKQSVPIFTGQNPFCICHFAIFF